MDPHTKPRRARREMFHVELSKASEEPKRKCSTPECANPARSGQRDCKACHAKREAEYRKQRLTKARNMACAPPGIPHLILGTGRPIVAGGPVFFRDRNGEREAVVWAILPGVLGSADAVVIAKDQSGAYLALPVDACE